MESLYFLVPVALIFIAIAVKILWWAIHNGQYDNLDTEAHRILFDDEKINSPKSISASHSIVKPITTTTATTTAIAPEQNKHD